MEQTPQEAIQILNAVRNEKEIQSYQEAQSVMKYFRQVEKAKKALAEKHPEIPENELDLYL